MLDQECNVARAQRAFDNILGNYASRGPVEYGYKGHDVWLRATARVNVLIETLCSVRDQTLDVLEIGCGDGMLGFLLAQYGHRVVLADAADWRDERSKQLPFLGGMIEGGLDVEGQSFDLVVSYNSFEHFEDPAAVTNELQRVVRPNGLMHFDFGPLYSSPYGMHCYRACPVPYCHYLFGEDFVKKYIRANSNFDDLGQTAEDTQPLNRWRVEQFRQIWFSEDFEHLNFTVHHDNSRLNIVLAYPDSFRGRGLTVDDLTATRIEATLRSKP